MTTKDKILTTALELFNQTGSGQVSTRHIAEAMNISVGNLYYHFKDKNVIIVRLYEQLVEELNTSFDQFQLQGTGMAFLMHSTKFTFSTLYKYRFLLLDFVHIMRGNPELKARYQQLTLLRKQQVKFAVNLLVQQSMIKGSIHEVPFEYLQMQLTIMGDFWISEGEILYQGKETDKIKFFTETMLYMFYPHLTDEGKKVFNEILPTLFE